LLSLAVAAFLGLAAGGLAVPVAASSPAAPSVSTYDRALALAAEGRADAALALLQAWQPDSAAGEEQKLWGQAVLLRRLGREAEALPLLETLVARRPDVPRFRIALGETLSSLGQTERARLHLQEALGGTPSEADRLRATKGLGALEVTEAWSGHFALSFIPATNAAQRTSARTIVLNGQTFTLAPSARKTSALGVQARAGISYAPRLADSARLRFGLSGDAKIYDGQAEDDVLLRAEAALVLDLGPDTQVEGGLTYSRRWIDGDGYSHGPGLTLGLVTYPDPQSRLQFAAVIDDLSHDSTPGLDGVRSLAVLAYGRALSPQLHVRGSLRAERTNALSASSSFTAWELGLGATYLFRGGMRVGVDASFRQADYDAVSAFFGQRRQDEQFGATLSLTHSELRMLGFAPVLELDYTRRTSSIPVYSFDDLSARIGLTRRF